MAPVSTSVPISPSSRPKKIMAKDLITEPRAITTAATRPSTISEKYSAGPNFCAMPASGGPAAAISSVPTHPARKEPSAAMASASPALPCRAIWWPSSVVTMDEASPGRLTRMAVVEPPYWLP